MRVAFDAGFPRTVFFTGQQCEDGKFQIGDRVFIAFSPHEMKSSLTTGGSREER